MRLLLVEDDAKTASFILSELRQNGYAVDHAADGEEGLHMATSEPYDAAVIDIMLPKLDGLVLIDVLRRKKINLPVIIVSAKRSTDDRVKGLQTGGTTTSPSRSRSPSSWRGFRRLSAERADFPNPPASPSARAGEWLQRTLLLGGHGDRRRKRETP